MSHPPFRPLADGAPPGAASHTAYTAPASGDAAAEARRNAAVFEGAIDCIVTTDADGRITGFNPAAERTFGRRRADVLGRSLVDVVVPPARRDAFGDSFVRGVTSQWELLLGRRVEATLARADGSELTAELAIGTHTAADGQRCFVLCMRDVTERGRVEKELRRRVEYFAAGQQLAPMGFWAWNPATGEGFASAEAHRLFGFDPDAEPRPALADFKHRIHPDDRPLYAAAREAAVREGRGFDVRYRVVLADGSVRHVRARGQPMLDETGKMRELVGTLVDVTEGVRSSRRLRRAVRARFEAALAERTRIARDMHDGLLQNLAGVAMQLAALLPHVRAEPGVVAERLARILELTERTGREAREAVVGMRDPAESVGLVSAVQNEARRVSEAETALAVAVRVAGRTRRVPARVRDVVVSVAHEAMTNVLKHADARAVRVALTFGRARLRLSIRDDGRGIAQDGGGGDAGRGEHLGFVGMRERAAEIGASLTVRSTPGRGTTVQLDVPLRR